MKRISSVVATFAILVAQGVGQETKGHFDLSGFTNLFDGKSLEGWTETGGRYDGDADWVVEDGAIRGSEGKNHAGGLLYTKDAYTNFIFSCDAWVSYPFDSGIFLRMSKAGKGAQVTLDYRADGEIGAIYADGFLAHNEAAKAKWKKDVWNRVEVKCVGRDFRLEVWLNGEKITDYTLPKGSEGYAPTGLIGIQVHGNRTDPEGSHCKFKNLFVRELPEFDSELFACDDSGALTPTDAGKAAGWKSLFNGKNLDGWETKLPEGAVVVKDGMMVFPSVPGDGDIRTKEDFRDFELMLDFKFARMANSGVFLRASRDGANPAFSGCEIQILDDFNWESTTKSKLKEWQFTGSLYGSAKPAVKALKPLGRWNQYRISAHGREMRCILNGQELWSVDTSKVSVPGGEKPFAERATTGFIGLQRHAGDEVEKPEYAWFRNIFIKTTEK